MANALLVYKQRHKPPNKANTAGKNTAHIIYIGTRPGVMKSSPEQQSGLFGNIGNGFSEHLDLNAVVSRADTISKAKKTMLRSVISFTSDQAKALKLKTLPDWQQYAKKQIPIIASHNNIKLENIEWAAAVHQKGDHPHVHIAFWDSSDRVQIQYIDPKVIGRLRCKLLDNTYPEMRERLIAAKNLSKEQLRQNYTAMAEAYEKYLLDSRYIDDLLADMSEEYSDSSGLTITDIQDMLSAENIKCFQELRKHLREHDGSMKYKLLPPEMKSEVNKFIDSLLDQSEKLRSLVHNFVNANLDLCEFYISNEDVLLKKKNEYYAEAKKMLANRLLRCIRDLNCTEENRSPSEPTGSNSSAEDTVLTIFSIFSYLSRMTSERTKVCKALEAGDLSKAALLERIRENRDKGIGVSQ